jgi:hypothetical protein
MTRSIVCTTSHDGQPVPYPTRAFGKSSPLPVISPASDGSVRALAQYQLHVLYCSLLMQPTVWVTGYYIVCSTLYTRSSHHAHVQAECSASVRPSVRRVFVQRLER